jgi:thioredoxin-related protein
MADLDWHGGDPEAAFALARASGRPLLLYWGAAWCPPCNRLKAAIFNRPDFLELAHSFVALHIDGDSAGAQQLAERFKLRSYPTLVVYRPDGAEVTRLPCELDGQRFVHILEVALNARYTVSQSLSVALSRERPLSDDEWRLLSYYSWDTDEQQLLKNLDFAAIVASMTRACTLPDALVRLEWLALHAAAMSGDGGVDRRAAIARLETTLTDARAVCEQLDIVTNYAVDLVRFLTAPDTDARISLTNVWALALETLENDSTLNIAARLAALRTRVRLSRLGKPIPRLDELVRERVANALHAVHDPALRHTVLNTAAGVLADAHLLDEAEQLLLAELDRSHAPFYFMHNLAAIAKKRGDPARAVNWYEQAWQGATGPATRLQWGATYLQGLVDFLPHDALRIERLAREMLNELGNMPDAFCQRNRTQMQRIDSRLALWGGRGQYAAALRQAVRHSDVRSPAPANSAQ